MSASASDAELVAVGRVGKAHGLRGEVAVEAWSDDPGRRFAAGVVLHARTTGTDFAVESARLHGERWLVRFAGVEDRNAAEALRGTVLVMPARERPPIEDPDEFYDSDLVGLHARDLAGADAVREHLVPFVAAIVVAVDIAAGVLTVDAPEGLFDL